jgi:ribose/xylose/arabinose/galactoside ABC-type transport system permease subunit
MSQSEIVPSKAEVSQTDLPKRGRIDLFSLAPYILLVVLVLAVVLLNPQLLSLQVLETKLNNGMPLLIAAVAQT